MLLSFNYLSKEIRQPTVITLETAAVSLSFLSLSVSLSFCGSLPRSLHLLYKQF